ncbi:hypothetical protein HDU93_003504, partial [Gonapodya sp. JEL0774]
HARHIRVEFLAVVEELERSLVAGEEPRGPWETADTDVSPVPLVRSVDHLLSTLSTLETAHYATKATARGTGVLLEGGVGDRVGAVGVVAGSGNLARLRGTVDEVMRRVDGIQTGKSDGGQGGSRGGRERGEKELQARGVGVGREGGEGEGEGLVGQTTTPQTLGERRARASFPNLRAMLEKKDLLDWMCGDDGGERRRGGLVSLVGMM